jgi:hypothetical protein
METLIAWNERHKEYSAIYEDAIASKKRASEATVYTRVHDHDIDGDSDHSQNQASSTDTEGHYSRTNTASRPIVRRRRQEPRPSPIKAMSLVGLKNLFFQQTVTAIPKRTKTSRECGMDRAFLFPTFLELWLEFVSCGATTLIE